MVSCKTSHALCTVLQPSDIKLQHFIPLLFEWIRLKNKVRYKDNGKTAFCLYVSYLHTSCMVSAEPSSQRWHIWPVEVVFCSVNWDKVHSEAETDYFRVPGNYKCHHFNFCYLPPWVDLGTAKNMVCHYFLHRNFLFVIFCPQGS